MGGANRATGTRIGVPREWGPGRGVSFLGGVGVWGVFRVFRNFREMITYGIGYDDASNKCLSLQKKIKSCIAME